MLATLQGTERENIAGLVPTSAWDFIRISILDLAENQC